MFSLMNTSGKLVAALVTAICILGVPSVYAQTNWGPVQRLNNPDQPNESNLIMASSDQTLMAVWTNNVITQNTRIATSTDNGLTWSDSRLVALPDQYRNLVSLGGGRWYMYSYYHYVTSSDDGLTWTEPAEINVAPNEMRGIAGSPDGTLIRAIINPAVSYFKLNLQRSIDMGATWESNQVLDASHVGQIIYTGNGNWLATPNTDDAGLYESADDGRSWTRIGPTAYGLASNGQGVVMSVRTESTMPGTDTYTANVYTRVSHDNGRTWHPEQLVHTQTETYQDLIVDYSPWVQVLWARDDQWVVFMRYVLSSRSLPFDSNRTRDVKIFMARTDDDGATFPSVERVPDDPSYPLLGANSLHYGSIGGNVVLAWVTGFVSGVNPPTGVDPIIAYRTGTLPAAPPPGPPPPPVEPPPPPPVDVTPAPDFTGVWAPAEAKCKTNKKSVTRCSLKAKFIVGNAGELKPDQKSIVRFYLSADSQLGISDVELKPKKVKSLKPGSGKTAKVKLSKLPAPVTGQYLIAVVDADGSVKETNENNNVIVSEPLP